ncbi:MAG: AbrB/MazE/SpoVT family DNA-binding domain-containing protein [Candidatus Aenigmatarchaeota archaeon]
MTVETVKMSSKGQIVIPQDIREEIRAEEGTVFAIAGSGDTLILKRINMPSKEDIIKNLDRISKENQRRLQKMGIKESDIPKIVERSRRK